MSRFAESATSVEPDGRCHAGLASVVVHGCDEPVPAGFWTCTRHAHELHQRGQELIAAAERKERAL